MTRRPHHRTSTPLLLALTLAAALGAPAVAEWPPGEYMVQALDTVLGGVMEAQDETALGFGGGVSLLAGFLQPGGSISLEVELEAGETYAVVGGGDDDASDVDLVITDAAGEVLGSDEAVDACPVLVWVPDESGPHTVTLSLFEAPEGCFCAMTLLSEKGTVVPAESLLQAIARFMGACEEMGGEVENLRFHDEDNQWCLYGAVLAEGEDAGVSSVYLEDGDHVFLGVADEDVEDLDLFLQDGAGNILEQDVLLDEVPIFAYTTEGESDYQLTCSNVASTTWTYAVFGILDAE